MSFKKIVLSTVLGFSAVATSVAMAGGVEQEAPAPMFQPNVYVEAHAGYAQVNWKEFNGSGVMGEAAVSYFLPNDNENGGVTGGADVGYSCTKYIAGEFGWFYLPEVKGTGTGNGTPGFANTVTAKVSSWLLYVGPRFTVPMVDYVNLFGKIGVAYRSLKYTAPSGSAELTSLTKDGGYWAPLFAIGMQYTREGWLIGAQYLHMTGNSEVNHSVAYTAPIVNGGPDAAPDVNLYTAYIGYQYNA